MAPRYIALLALVPTVFGLPGLSARDTMSLQQAAPAAPVAGPPGIITGAQALAVINAAAAAATTAKTPSNIAVTDPYGHLVAFLRQDGAVLASVEVAQKKARTVSLFGGKIRSGDLLTGKELKYLRR
jgi:hypothetical protein